MLNVGRKLLAKSIAMMLIVAGCGQSRDIAPSSATIGSQIATVFEVIDGDTLDLSINGHRERVRLIGVDTPETKHPRKPVQCFGHEASAYTASLLPRGTKVRLERDVEARDFYDRLLLYLYRRSDNMFINLELVRQGYAHVLTIAPNVVYVDRFVAAAGDAQAYKRGLWQACRG